ILQVQTGRFKNVRPSSSNTLNTYIGQRGISISATANLDKIRVDLYIGKSNKVINDEVFEYIKKSMNEIEELANYEFIWQNQKEYIASKISIEFDGIGISDESNWDTCIGLLIDGVNTIAEFLLPKVEEYFNL